MLHLTIDGLDLNSISLYLLGNQLRSLLGRPYRNPSTDGDIYIMA